MLVLFVCSCNPFPTARGIDLKKEWAKNSEKLKELAQRIAKDPSSFQLGINDFPDDFDYPFDDGYFLDNQSHQTGQGKADSTVTIKFYTDRGLLDHYSAIVYTNNANAISALDANVANGGNDFKLEENWYAIND